MKLSLDGTKMTWLGTAVDKLSNKPFIVSRLQLQEYTRFLNVFPRKMLPIERHYKKFISFFERENVKYVVSRERPPYFKANEPELMRSSGLFLTDSDPFSRQKTTNILERIDCFFYIVSIKVLTDCKYIFRYWRLCSQGHYQPPTTDYCTYASWN